MKRNNYKAAIAMVLVLFIASCKKDISVDSPPSGKDLNKALVYKLPTTIEEKQLVENLTKVTGIFKELYKDKANIKVVNASIYAKAYTDGAVLLKDLIYVNNSRLTTNARFRTLTQKWNVQLTSFADKFWIEVNKRNDPAFKSFLKDLDQKTASIANRTATDGDNVSVYYPYYEEFEPADGGSYEPITSIATATADADEGWGDLPYYIDGVFQHYVQVLVNDDYAFNNPTHIIGVNGIEAIEESLDPQDPPPPPPPPGVSRIYIGEGICKKQWDRLISFTGNGGGSEIKYCHLTGYLQPVNGHVTSFQDIASVGFSRGDIRNKRFLRTYIIWDDDWEQADLEQVLAIYEEDNTHTVTFTGSLGTTLTVDTNNTITASIGYTIVRESQDPIIRQLKISRHSYFAGAFRDQAWGFSSDQTFIPPPVSHGWPIYDATASGGADVGWTWPYNTY